MIKQKKKICSVCGQETFIFSKKRCKFCATKEDSKPLKKATEKSKEKRKEDRKDFPKFFMDAIEQLKLNPYCQNCGVKINVSIHPTNNIAHILSKMRYKSVSTHSSNYVFLCSGKDNLGNSCHEKFDNYISDRPNMPVFKIVLEKYKTFSEEVLEYGKEKSIFEENLQDGEY